MCFLVVPLAAPVGVFPPQDDIARRRAAACACSLPHSQLLDLVLGPVLVV
jgi:hypothetical protein